MKFVLPFFAALMLVACTENTGEATPIDPNPPTEENVPGPCGTAGEVDSNVNCQQP